MPDTHPEDIKAAIRKKGETLSSLAIRNGMSPQALAFALQARSSARAEQVIADFLELKPREIWPSRYGRDGKRITMRKVAA